MVLTIFCGQYPQAEKAFATLVDAGVAPESVSVLASGREADRRLIPPEQAADLHVLEEENAATTSPLFERGAGEKPLLYDRIWAIGPLFVKPVPHRVLTADDAASALENGGLPVEESVGILQDLQDAGGVWMAAQVDGEPPLRALTRKLEELPAVAVKTIAAQP